MASSLLQRRLLIGGAVAVLLLAGAGFLFALSTWEEVNRVTIERPDAGSSSGPVADDDESSSDDEAVESLDEPTDVGLQVFLLVGSDSRIDLETTDGFGDFEGNRADTVMILFKDGSNTGLLSLPRDLLVEDPCRGGEHRIADMLEGCPTMNGPTLLLLAVEELIGESVDHFALVDLAGFQAAVDAVGGYEICVERPVRDRRANLELPEGCILADGEDTLAWLRSRHTQELTESGWRTMPGVNDLVRNERQRAFLVDMMTRVADVTSPQAMAQTAQAVAPYVTVDDDLSLVRAVNLALTMRGLSSGSITEMEVPVYDDTTSGGAAVLRASTPVEEIVAEFLSATAAEVDTVVGFTG
ncbi:MAG TPA: LCP family protein [Acidimicrobiia bacterium]|nr:LCP family protein [Acidimicrobiia bacterium]